MDEKKKKKKDKEKRERKRFKEDQDKNYRIFAQKSMNDMVNLMENNLKKENKEQPIKLSENILKNNEIKKEENLKNINIKEHEKSKEINKNEDKKKITSANKISTGRSRNKSKNISEDNETNDSKIKEELLKKEEENKENIIEEKAEIEKMGQTATSSYSKLSANDYGLGLINECFSIHNFNIGFNCFS